jgi:hypothetical protein
MNYTTMLKFLIPCILSLPLISCTGANGQSDQISPPKSKDFNNYWYSGQAELTRYELKQARYGEIHEGEAVLIFVTEDFRTDAQVKYEGGDRNNVESVLKLNFTRKFFTGLYPYSMMSSIFTPVNEKKPTIKVTTSSQEWCGHTFSQLNLKKNTYQCQLLSYFQNEGDQNFTVEAALLEDEIWSKIRLNPSSLPLGDIDIIPGTMFLRLKHKGLGVEQATASSTATKDASLSSEELTTYRIDYKTLGRSLSITFESKFPYAIVAWEEEIPAGFGKSGTLTTRAVRTHSIRNDYWSKNGNENSDLRKTLGLNASNY